MPGSSEEKLGNHYDFEVIQENCQDNMNLSEKLQEAEEELKLWQVKIDKLEKQKSELICEKLDADERKKQAAQQLCTLSKEQENLERDFEKAEQSFKEKLFDKKAEGAKLKGLLLQLENELHCNQQHCDLLRTKFKVNVGLPEKNIKFTKLEESVPIDQEGEDFLKIKCCYNISPKVFMVLQNGQALVTFEDEQVANRILKVPKHHIMLDSGKMDVKVQPVKLDTARKFEIHVDISRKTVKVSQIPNKLPEEQMRDKLEISFSKPSLGGGEVENISYDCISGTALVTFVEKGIAQHVAEQKKYKIILNETQSCWVMIESVWDYDLGKFQTFNGICKRTVLISDIKNELDEEELQDKLEIHFQKPSNHGGEVENIKYVPKDQHLTVYLEQDVEEK
ncbi:N-myc-interactor isoform X1 [Carcharodon carcharias]|uniref:N-myc-interactor isoform X1 n=2 Tax=Carcharodon carcharias TaxID=13397 RepID=UPI001B7E7215|nr:N-myc-interactor isoform X1 [Carcharodon carcharias]